MHDHPDSLWAHQPRQAYAALLTTQRGFASHSIAQYSAMLGAAADWIWQHRRRTLLTLDHTDLQAFIQGFVSKTGDPPSPATLVRYIKRFDHVMTYLVTAQLRRDNPVSRLGSATIPADVTRPDPPFLNWEQSEQFIATVGHQPCLHWVDLRNRAIQLLFLASGITVAECRRLQSSDLVRHQDVFHLRISSGSKKNPRTVPLPEWCHAPLAAWLERRHTIVKRHLASRVLTTTPGKPSDWLFLGKSKANSVQADGSDLLHKPMSASELYEVVRPAVTTVNPEALRQVGPQTLRNTYVLRQLREGVDDGTIMQAMGLKTRFTLDTLRPFARLDGHPNC